MHDLSPYARSLEHVGFVHTGHLAAALLRKLERETTDTLDLEFSVSHHVVTLSAELAFAYSLFAEVYAADEFSDHEHIYVFGIFERADISQRVEQFRGTQVGIKSHCLSDAEQRALGTLFVGQGVVLRTAHRAQQNAVAFQTFFKAFRRERLAVFVISRAAAYAVFKVESMIVFVAYFFEHFDCRRGDLRTYAVAGDNGDIVFHILPQLNLSALIALMSPPHSMMFCMNLGNGAACQLLPVVTSVITPVSTLTSTVSPALMQSTASGHSRI